MMSRKKMRFLNPLSQNFLLYGCVTQRQTPLKNGRYFWTTPKENNKIYLEAIQAIQRTKCSENKFYSITSPPPPQINAFVQKNSVWN